MLEVGCELERKLVYLSDFALDGNLLSAVGAKVCEYRGLRAVVQDSALGAKTAPGNRRKVRQPRALEEGPALDLGKLARLRDDELPQEGALPEGHLLDRPHSAYDRHGGALLEAPLPDRDAARRESDVVIAGAAPERLELQPL